MFIYIGISFNLLLLIKWDKNIYFKPWQSVVFVFTLATARGCYNILSKNCFKRFVNHMMIYFILDKKERGGEVNWWFTSFFNHVWLYMMVSFHSWMNTLFLGVNQQPSVGNWQLPLIRTTRTTGLGKGASRFKVELTDDVHVYI